MKLIKTITKNGKTTEHVMDCGSNKQLAEVLLKDPRYKRAAGEAEGKAAGKASGKAAGEAEG